MHDEWEGGERHGVAWKLLLVAAGLAAVLVTSWTTLRAEGGMTVQSDRNPVAGSSEEPDVVLQRPVRAGDQWGCGEQHRVRAYDSGWYYPPEHPSVPDFTLRPEACFLHAEWAESAGYDLAPTPPAAVHIGALYLVPTVAPTVEACGEVAEVVNFAVPCPRRLPAPGRGVSCTNSCLFYGRARHPGVVIEQRGFALPIDWCTDCAGDVVVTATRDRSPPELVTCGPEMVIAARAGKEIAGYHECGPGPPWLPGIAGFPHEEHTLLVWEDGDMTYAVSMDGHSAQIRSVLLGLRADIELVPPPGW